MTGVAVGWRSVPCITVAKNNGRSCSLDFSDVNKDSTSKAKDLQIVLEESLKESLRPWTKANALIFKADMTIRNKQNKLLLLLEKENVKTIEKVQLNWSPQLAMNTMLC